MRSKESTNQEAKIMLVPEPPLDAYRSDLARNKSREELGDSDTVWLLTAHCLARIARSSMEDLEVLGTNCSNALRDFTVPDDTGKVVAQSGLTDLLEVVEGLARIREQEGAGRLVRGVRGMVIRMVEANALSMAYTTADLARRAGERADDRDRALLVCEQAMVARLLGDLDAADALYQSSEAIGDRIRDFGVLARCYVGRGVVDRVRGNYPRSRIYFERGLELAESARDKDLMRLANQGLTICHAIAKNYDRALQHGWTTYRLSEGQPNAEVESLSNLAQLSLDSGYPVAALRGFAAVLGRADSPRVSLGALGGMALAAARGREPATLVRVAGQVDAVIESSALPYENAQALYHLAMAFAIAGERRKGLEYLERARKVAKTRGFFELIHKTDVAEFNRAATPRVHAAELSPPTREVLASIAELDPGEAAGVLAISRP